MALGLPDLIFDIRARDRSRQAWRGLESNVTRARRAVMGLVRAMGPLLGVGGAVSLAGLGAAARQSLQFAQNLVTTADRVTFTVEALQELRFAAREYKVQQSALDMGLQRFARRIAEAARGQGEFLGVVQDYGLELRDANGQMRASNEILLDFADIVANAESEQEQLRLAFKAFDSEGAAMVNLLSQGRGEMERLADRARELGIVMSEDAARGAASAQRRIAELSETIRGNFTRSVAEAAPEIEELADTIMQAMPHIIEAFENGTRAALAFARAIGTEADALPSGQSALRERALEVDRLAAGFERLERNLDRLDGRSFGRAVREGDMSRVPSVDALEREFGRTETLAMLNRAGLTPQGGIRPGTEDEVDLSEIQARIASRQSEILMAQLAARERELQAREREEQNRAAAGGGAAESSGASSGASGAAGFSPIVVANTTGRTGSTGGPIKRGTAGIPITNAEADKAKREAQAALDAQRDLSDEQAALFADTFSEGLMTALFGREGDFEAFIHRNALRGLEDAFRQLAPIVQDLLSSILPGLFDNDDGGFLSTVASAFASSLGFGGGGGAPNKGLKFGGGKAGGGAVRPGFFYRVNEAGEEFFAPTVPGEVIRADRAAAMRGGRGGAPVTQNITVQVNGVRDFDSFLRNEGRMRRSAASAAQSGLRDIGR